MATIPPAGDHPAVAARTSAEVVEGTTMTPRPSGGDTASAGDSDAARWTTDEGQDEWEARFRDDPPQDPGDESSDEEVAWPLCDDIQVA